MHLPAAGRAEPRRAAPTRSGRHAREPEVEGEPPGNHEAATVARPPNRSLVGHGDVDVRNPHLLVLHATQEGGTAFSDDFHVFEGDEVSHESRHSPGTIATVLTSWPALSLSWVQLIASCTVSVG